MPGGDLEWALHEFRDANRLAGYRLARDYYDGQHRVSYDDRRFRSIFGQLFRTVRANICQVVVDSLTDRLEVVAIDTPGNKAAKKRAAGLWSRNLMDLVANETHREAFKTGDAYVIVQPDDTGAPSFWFNSADQVVVAYSDRSPGRVDKAAKLWQSPDGWRLNLYYRDHIEKYLAAAPARSRSTRLDPSRFAAYSADGLSSSGVIPWDYGEVPVFHFANRALYSNGFSELAEVIPLQDAVNKTISDLLITSEFSSFKQRWVVGLDPEALATDEGQKFLTGVDRLMVASDPNARFGEFSASDLGQFLNVVDHFMRQVARISGIPLHFIYEVSGDFPSGDALKTAEARFNKKLGDKQVAFGNVWERMMRYALRVDGLEPRGDVAVEWLDTSPTSQKETWEVALLKKAAGVPTWKVLAENGYDEAEAREFAADAEAKAAQAAPPDPASAVVPTPTGRIQVDRTGLPA